MTVRRFRFRSSRPVAHRRRRALALAVAVAACVSVRRADAADQNARAPFTVGSREHVSYASSGVHPEAAPEPSPGAAEAPLAGAAGSNGALVINATFDGSITSDPNAAAIEATINDAIAIYESSLNDPTTVSIRFRYATTRADGSTPLPPSALSLSESVVYGIPWTIYVDSLMADATTANDVTATATLPTVALSPDVDASSANGRALGLNTPPALFADGRIGSGGPYDGIVTLNSSQSFKFTRPPATAMLDALRTTEHEMDEVLGLGSDITVSSDLRPQDLFSWSAAGVRNVTSSGSRFFSIDDGTTNLVGFNQDPTGDFGDWLSGSCPQTHPYVQNAFSCADQASDVMQTSPEGVTLDVIGYDLIIAPTPTATPGPCGDADGNGLVTVSDGVQVLRAAAGLSSTCTPARCDVDGSGAITVTDGVAVLRKAAGLSAPSACPSP